MQQILNHQERNQAFLKFLAFFLVTTILVVTAIYFNFRVPVKENEWLQTQLDIQRTQDASQVRFVAKMEEALSLFAQLNKKDANTPIISHQLTNAINEMQDLNVNEKSLYGRMNTAIVSKFTQYKAALDDLDRSKASVDQLAVLRAELTSCTDKLALANSRLDNYTRPNPAQ